MKANEIKFEIGKVYKMRAIGDHECIWRFTVTARTASTITLRGDFGNDKPRTFRVAKRETEWDGAEVVFPLGRYSMAPVLRAREVA